MACKINMASSLKDFTISKRKNIYRIRERDSKKYWWIPERVFKALEKHVFFERAMSQNG